MVFVMDDLRSQIDGIDAQIVRLLAKRMDLVKEVGELKKASDQPIVDENREEALRETLKSIAKEEGLSEEFVNHLYTHIFIESRRVQEEG
jgi:monofunctional chorismate mutase